MDQPTDYSDLSHGILVGAFSLAAIAVSLKRLSRLWQGETRDTLRINAETDVIKLLREELDRVSKHNVELSTEVQSLRELILQLQQSNLRFETTVRMLHAELEKLRKAPHVQAP